jgi:hypothetical protein
MRVPEEPVCIYLFRQNPVLTSLHLRPPVHVAHRRSKRYGAGGPGLPTSQTPYISQLIRSYFFNDDNAVILIFGVSFMDSSYSPTVIVQ